MDSTQIVAWWGGTVATLVLLWDITKWIQAGPKIKSRIYLNAQYGDGKVISREKKEYGEVVIYEKYCHIELINIGTMPTTVMGISATHKKRKNFGQFGTAAQAFTEHFGKKLPNVISPGEVWSCRLPMHHYHSILKHGEPEVHVSLSHIDKPLIIRATKAVNNTLRRDDEAVGTQ